MNSKLCWKQNTGEVQFHHYCLPSPSMRAIIIGESGCGKTTLLLNLLLQDKWLDYNKLVLCGRSLHQPEYQLLISALEKGYQKNEIRKLYEQGSGEVQMFINELPSKMTKNIDLEVYDCNSHMPDPRDLDMSRKNICVFDDMVTESNKNLAESYYTCGRQQC